MSALLCDLDGVLVDGVLADSVLVNGEPLHFAAAQSIPAAQPSGPQPASAGPICGEGVPYGPEQRH